MSLWDKPLKDITFQDVDVFLGTKQPESNWLDYKVDNPKDIAKTIAAFANTLGGLIVLGVDADKTDNLPVWPPMNGMPTEAGLEERIVQIARQAIHPPVRISVSRVLDNALLPGHAVVVVRVDESPDAPHAVEKKRKVFIYERAENTSDPHTLADIDRIAFLINRRSRWEADREAAIRSARARSRRQMRQSNIPLRWASVVPLYPSRPLCDLGLCHTLHQSMPLFDILPDAHWRHNRVPDGSCALAQRQISEENTILASHSVSANGLVFGTAFAYENLTRYAPDGLRRIHYEETERLAKAVFANAKAFYESSNVQRPGFLLVSLGVANALGSQMYAPNLGTTRSTFPDEEFRFDLPLHAEEFLSDTDKAVKPVLDHLMFGFNLL